MNEKQKQKTIASTICTLVELFVTIPVSISNKELKLLMNCAVWKFTFDSACMFCQDQRITSIAVFFFSFTKITKHAWRRLYPGQSLIRWVSIIQMVDNHYLQEKVFFRRFPREATSSIIISWKAIQFNRQNLNW